MNSISVWVATGLLRASLGLSIGAIAVACSVRLLRPRAPRAEQFAWLLVLAQGVILAPIPIPVPSRLRTIAEPHGDHRTARELPPRSSQSYGELTGRNTIAPDVGEPVSRRQTRPETRVTAAIGGVPASHTEPLRGWAVALLVIWFAGVCSLAAVGFVRFRAFAASLCTSRPVEAEWQAEWQAILEVHRIRTSIPLFVSQSTGPALCFLASGYRLVVPEDLWRRLAPNARGTILRHELAHYRRGDLWTALLARTLATVHWYNPLAWWAASRFEAEAEFLCDQVSANDAPASYAAVLLEIGSTQCAQPAFARAARTGDLYERVTRLLTVSAEPARWKCALPVILAVLALGPNAVRPRAKATSGSATDPANAATSATAKLPARALLRLGTNDLRTRSFITSTAFSADGKQLAAVSANSAVPAFEIFDVSTGQRVQRLSLADLNSSWVVSVAFSPDNTRLVWGESDGHVAVWDRAAGRVQFREQRHGGEVSDVCFSPDGSVIASAGSDGTVELRTAANPNEIVRRIKSGERQPAVGALSNAMPAARGADVGPLHLAFTPDGARLVVGSGSSATISVWRIKDGALLRRMEKTHGVGPSSFNPSLNYVAVTHDGRTIMSAGQRTVPITQTKLKYGPKNVTLAEVRFWDLESGRRVRDLLEGEDNGFGYAALSADGKHVAVGDFGVLRVLDVETGKTEQTIALPGSWGRQPVFSPDGNLVAMPIENVIAVFDVKTGRRLLDDDTLPSRALISADWSPAGDRIVTGHGDGEVRVWDASTGKVVWHHALAPVISPSGRTAYPLSVMFSGDGRRVVAAGGRDDPIDFREGIVVIYEAAKGLVVRKVIHKRIRHAALSPNRKVVVVATTDGAADDTQLHGIEVESGRMLFTTPPYSQPGKLWQMRAIQFQPDSGAFVAALGDGAVIQFDALTGREQRRFLADWRPEVEGKARGANRPELWEGAFSADARTLASSSGHFVYVWDVETGKLRRSLKHPHENGCRLALSPDGRTLATSDLLYGGDFGVDTIRLYDVESGQQVLTLEPDDNRAGVLSFSPDGEKLLTGFGRGSGIVWDVRRGTNPSGPRP